jgi:hypothetical protein
MKSLLNNHRAHSREIQFQLEDAASAAPDAKNLPELLAPLPETAKEHAAACKDCRSAAETILAARALLREMPSNATLGGPWFAPRVMASISARRAELGDALTIVPKLAARLTWASIVALLLASTWIYQRPVSPPPTPVLTDITGEPVADNVPPATNDEVLVSLAERTR